MFNNAVKKVINIDNNEQLGTCFFINSDTAITARHVINGKYKLGIVIREDKFINAEAIPNEGEEDIGILKCFENVILEQYFELESTEIFSDSDWETFGYPQIKPNGDRILGKVSIPQTSEKFLYDIDLRMYPDPGLEDYSCLSGSPVLIGTTVQAIVKYKPGGTTLGGVKICRCENFLDKNNIPYKKNYSAWLHWIKDKYNDDSKNSIIKIARQGLLDDIEDFAKSGHGLVIGQAGIGKSYTLKEMYSSLVRKGIPAILISIDDFVAANDDEIKKELFIDDNLDLMGKINKEFGKLNSSEKGIVIFDSFDSARNEEVKERFLKIIKNLIKQSNSKINVLVSIRTFDAEKSQKLLDMFPQNDCESNSSKEFSNKCRSFIINELDEEDIKNVFIQLKIDQDIIPCISSELIKVLKIPFFLWIFEKTYEKISDRNRISSINSEVQLLEEFWNQRINGDNRESLEYVLLSIVKNLVDKKTLSVGKSEVFRPEIQNIWNELFSSSILKNTDMYGSKIAFAHNILFDYAVSRLLLTNEVNSFLDFIIKDKTRVIFLRPSIFYFLNKIWYENKELFWKLLFLIIENKEIPSLTKFYPIQIIIINAKTIDDFKILINKYMLKDKIAIDIVERIFKLIDTEGINDYDLLAAFIDKIAKDNYEGHFGWIVSLANKVIDKLPKDGTLTSSWFVCAELLRNLLSTIWGKKDFDAWLDRVAAQGIIPGIIKTYSSNSYESKELLRKIILNINEDGDNLIYVASICRNINYLWDVDFEFVNEIFPKVFSVNVTNTDQTQIGNSTIMNLTSNKKQDYEMIKYELGKQFKGFIKLNPLKAIELGIDIINTYIINRLNNNKELVACSFTWNGKNAEFIEDESHFWANGYSYENINEIIAETFNYIRVVSKEGKVKVVENILEIFQQKAKVAYLWANFISIAAEYANLYYKYVFDLCISNELICCNDTLQQVGALIESCVNYFDGSEVFKIEEQICSINCSYRSSEGNEHLKRRLISRIPKALINTEKAKVIYEEIEKSGHTYNNKPLVSIRTEGKEITYEDRLTDLGIKTNEKISLALEKVYKYNYKNEESDSLEMLNILIELYKDINEVKNDPILLKEMVGQISEGMKKVIIDRINNHPEEIDSYKKVIIGCASQQNIIYQEKDFKGLHLGYVSTPKHVAAKIMPFLYDITKDLECIEIIKSLLNHPVISVRCILAEELWRIYDNGSSYFKELANFILEKEQSAYVKKMFIRSMPHLIYSNNKQMAINILTRLFNDKKNRVDYINNSLDIIINLYITDNDIWAKTYVDEIMEYPDSYMYDGPNGYVAIIYDTICAEANGKIEEEKVDRAILLVKRFLNKLSFEISNILCSIDKNNSEDVKKKLEKLYKIFGWFIDNIYYRSGALKKDNEEIPEVQIKNYCFKVKVLLETLIENIKKYDNLFLHANNIHCIIQYLKFIFAYDPVNIIKTVSFFVLEGVKTGYRNDSLAVNEVLDIINTIFVDFKPILHDSDVSSDMIKILDTFIDAGWSQAIDLIWRLEEVYR